MHLEEWGCYIAVWRKDQVENSVHLERLMGLTTVERVLGCVRDYLEGAQSKILRCAIAVSTNLPENHEKKHRTQHT